jgi:hypothetical protein
LNHNEAMEAFAFSLAIIRPGIVMALVTSLPCL